MANRKLITAAMLTALSAAMGYAFMAVPNIELFTATVFISGFIAGPAYGSLIGALAELIYGTLNPFGASAMPLLIAQIISMSLVGFIGGLLRVNRWMRFSLGKKIIICALCGFFLTLIFDILTTLSFAVFIAQGDTTKIASIYASGALFYVTHLIVNTAIFATVVPIILNRVRTYQTSKNQ